SPCEPPRPPRSRAPYRGSAVWRRTLRTSRAAGAAGRRSCRRLSPVVESTRLSGRVCFQLVRQAETGEGVRQRPEVVEQRPRYRDLALAGEDQPTPLVQ